MANWGMAIRINQYQNMSDLNYAKGDAEAMADWYEEAGFDKVYPNLKSIPDY